MAELVPASALGIDDAPGAADVEARATLPTRGLCVRRLVVFVGRMIEPIVMGDKNRIFRFRSRLFQGDTLVRLVASLVYKDTSQQSTTITDCRCADGW